MIIYEFNKSALKIKSLLLFIFGVVMVVPYFIVAFTFLIDMWIMIESLISMVAGVMLIIISTEAYKNDTIIFKISCSSITYKLKRSRFILFGMRFWQTVYSYQSYRETSTCIEWLVNYIYKNEYENSNTKLINQEDSK